MSETVAKDGLNPYSRDRTFWHVPTLPATLKSHFRVDGFVLYDFKIDAWAPETLPLSRLGDYASELARLFGSESHVHLLKVRRGSAVAELAVSEAANPQISRRLALLGGPDAAEDAARSYRNLNQLLRDDRTSAVLRLKRGARVIAFPGVKTPLAEEVVVHEPGTLDGVVIRVGGLDETVPVWLQGENREKLPCTSSRSIAKELAQHLFGSPVRVSGLGKWRRDAARSWELQHFTIKSWELLDDTSLVEAVAQLREVPGNEWNELDNPQAEWRRLRGET